MRRYARIFHIETLPNTVANARSPGSFQLLLDEDVAWPYDEASASERFSGADVVIAPQGKVHVAAAATQYLKAVSWESEGRSSRNGSRIIYLRNNYMPLFIVAASIIGASRTFVTSTVSCILTVSPTGWTIASGTGRAASDVVSSFHWRY